MTSSLLFSYIDKTQIWEEYKSHFIQKDGRIIDFHNNAITHTEGIGYGLYFAYKMGDDSTFRSIYKWGKANIKKNNHGLPGWKWGKNKSNSWGMIDYNSASDANLWIVYSLLLMYNQTGYQPYKQDADEMIDAIKSNHIVADHGLTILLPWEKNIAEEYEWNINPSYLIFEIFEYLAEYDGDKIWNELIKSSILILKKTRFSSLELNPDWSIYSLDTKKFSLHPKHNKFGYDAIRIPLNIIRSDLSSKEKEALLKPYREYIEMMKYHPLGVVDLKKGIISLYDMSCAQIAVYMRIAEFYNYDTSLFRKRLNNRMKKNNEDYYAYSLYLLSIL
jgi:endoglucanase